MTVQDMSTQSKKETKHYIINTVAGGSIILFNTYIFSSVWEEAVEGQPTDVANLDNILDTLCPGISGLSYWTQASYYTSYRHDTR